MIMDDRAYYTHKEIVYIGNQIFKEVNQPNDFHRPNVREWKFVRACIALRRIFLEMKGE